MREKVFFAMVMAVVLSFSFVLIVSANDDGGLTQTIEDFRDSIARQVSQYQEVVLLEPSGRSMDSNELAQQIGRLWSLLFEGRTEGRAANPTVPHIVFMATPEPGQPYFWIGLTTEPTEDDIAFILSYTGIPRERAKIQIADTGRLMPLSLEELQESLQNTLVDSEYEDIRPLARTTTMGRLIHILANRRANQPANRSIAVAYHE